MFYKATKFNGDVSNWNVSSVTNMGDQLNIYNNIMLDVITL